MEKTDKEQKAEMIRKIAEAIDKNTSTARDVWCILHAIQDGLTFIEDKRYQYKTDIPMSIRYMRKRLEEGSERSLYDDITDDFLECILLAGANAEGLILINSEPMKGALIDISDEYNS